MEALNEFVRVSYGDGSGYGSGYGYGSGSGDGSGDGSGSGDGYGYGYGSGYSYGYSYGNKCPFDIVAFSGYPVRVIDDVATVLYHIHIGTDLSIAKGAILHDDLTVTPCYVVKRDGIFAHGSDLHDAMQSLTGKLVSKMDDSERINAFIAEFGIDVSAEFPTKKFFDWHHVLTGSCIAGRMAFARDHGIDVENGEMTVNEFFSLTRDSYMGEIIQALERKILDAEKHN